MFSWLQATLLAWSSPMSGLRDAHRCLNFYTTDQLVLLAGQLAGCVYKGLPLSGEVTMLLRLIAGGKFFLSWEVTILLRLIAGGKFYLYWEVTMLLHLIAGGKFCLSWEVTMLLRLIAAGKFCLSLEDVKQMKRIF